VVKKPKIVIDDKENSKKLYLSLLKSQIFNSENQPSEKNQRKKENKFLLNKKRSKIQINNTSNFSSCNSFACGKILNNHIDESYVYNKGKDFIANEKLVSILKEKEFSTNDFNFFSEDNSTPHLIKRRFFSKDFSNEFNSKNKNFNHNYNTNTNSKYDEIISLTKYKKEEMKIPFELSTQMRSNLEHSISETYSNLKHEKIENLINLSNSASKANSFICLENTYSNKDNYNNDFYDHSCKKNLNLNGVFGSNNNNQDAARNISDNNNNTCSVSDFIERNKNVKLENNNNNSMAKDNFILNSKLKEKPNLITNDLLLSLNASNFQNDKSKINKKNSDINLIPNDTKINNIDNNSCSLISNANTNSNFSSLSNLSFVKNKEINANSSQITSPIAKNNKDKLANFSQRRKFSSFIFDEIQNSASTEVNPLSDSLKSLARDVNLARYNNDSINNNSLYGSNKTISDNIFTSYKKNNHNNIDDFINNNAQSKNGSQENLSYTNKKINFRFNNIISSCGVKSNIESSCVANINPPTANSTSLLLNLNSDLDINQKLNEDCDSNSKGISSRISFLIF